MFRFIFWIKIKLIQRKLNNMLNVFSFVSALGNES